MTLPSGTRLGRYEIRSFLGAGGMGEVYLAQDTQLERAVALKVLPPTFADNTGSIRRFTQEAKAASALNHPHILTIFEIGQTDSSHFIATEFIEGETLRRRIASGPLKLGEVLSIATQVSDALSAAHEAGIIHRDVKPENIMLRRRDGYIKVLDFGLAKLIAPQTASVDTEAPTKAVIVTDPGTVLGTVQYMSPEQARGQRVDARTDIFSLGVVIYEMVAGRPPFEGQTKTDVINSIIDKEPPPLARYAREVPETLEWIVTKALRKDKEERYQTARELLTDLRSLKQRLEFAAEQERSVPPMSQSEAAMTTASLRASIATLEAADTQTEKTAHPTTSAEYLVSEVKQHKRGVIVVLVAFVLLIAGVILGVRYVGRNKTEPAFSSIKLTRLTNTGKGRGAAISPDGKYIVHVLGDPAQQSIWLRHIATGSDKEIAPSAGASYCCPAFSPDGNHVYYLRTQTNVATVLYQLPVLGGSARTILEDVDSSPAFSSDGRKFAFVRGRPADGFVDLLVANMDGNVERIIATYPILNFFVPGNASLPAWSPDGETIVIGAPASDDRGNYRRMLAVRVKDGAATQLTAQRWSVLGQFAWLADGKGLIFTASDQAPGSPQQIWHMSYPGGETRKLTNDLNDYRGVSLTADNTAIVTVPFERLSNIWVVPEGETNRAAQITSRKYDGLDGIAFAADDRVVYTSRAGGTPNLWIVNADGTNQKQLTAGNHSDFWPAASADGRYVVFISDRAGRQNIWRINIDGANPTQLTSGQADANPSCTSDSRWVTYTSNDNGNQRLQRVSIDGGNATQLTDYASAQPVVSPDGKQIACTILAEHGGGLRQMLAIIPVAGGQPIKKFDIAVRPLRLRWTSDSHAVTYILTRAGISNIWRQAVEGGDPAQLTAFKSDQIYFYDWSRDGRQLSLARGSVTSDVVLISGLK